MKERKITVIEHKVKKSRSSKKEKKEDADDEDNIDEDSDNGAGRLRAVQYSHSSLVFRTEPAVITQVLTAFFADTCGGLTWVTLESDTSESGADEGATKRSKADSKKERKRKPAAKKSYVFVALYTLILSQGIH